MSNPNDQNYEELRDRLADNTLREVLGSESPPDLSESILRKANRSEKVMTKQETKSNGSWRALSIVTAVCALGLVAFASSVWIQTGHFARQAETAHVKLVKKSQSPRKKKEASKLQKQMIVTGQPASPTNNSVAAPFVFFLSNTPKGVTFDDLYESKVRTPGVRLYEDSTKSESRLYMLSGLDVGPGGGGDQYTRIHENPFVVAKGTDAVSTFSIDVDTASYTNVRQYLMAAHQLPPPDAVRLEEFINYFDYDYEPPTDDKPFASHIEVATCPWQPKHRIVRIGLKGKEIDRRERPDSNLVFLVDVSGSMQDSNKLPLVIEGLKQLTNELGEDDKVAIVVYANSEGLALPSTRGHRKEEIRAVLGNLKAGGSTAGGAGIELAYRVAEENFISDGTNRVILCTDGDFNVGVTSTGDLERMAEKKAKSGVFLTVLGFGRGNLNDAMMEQISNKGNGNYHYVDNTMEARKVLVEQMSGTLVTIAKDVKIQVEFNPAKVAGYRLLGYENRMLAREDFNDDTKDAGEIGAGHAVTALYEIVPVGTEAAETDVEPLKYQTELTDKTKDLSKTGSGDSSSFEDELLEVRFRYKEPGGATSKLLKFTVTDSEADFASASDDYQFATAVAGFGMLLRDSQHAGDATMENLIEIASSNVGDDEFGYRAGLIEMMRRAKELGK